MLFTFNFLDNVCAFTKTKKSVNDFRWQFRVLSAYAFVFWKIFEHVSNLPPKIRQTKRMKITNEKTSGLQKNWKDFYNSLQKFLCFSFHCTLVRSLLDLEMKKFQLQRPHKWLFIAMCMIPQVCIYIFLTASSPTQSKELLFWLVDLLPTTSHLPNLKHITSCYVIQVLYDMNWQDCLRQV